MQNYTHNAKWLVALTPFRTLSISSAYLTPFFLSQGMTMSMMFVLQSAFSVVLVAWEIPSGMIADRYGRAFCIKAGIPLSGLAMLAYPLFSNLWWFLLCEAIMAIGMGLIGGIDRALLYDSLKAQNLDGEALETEFTKWRQRSDAAGFAVTAAMAPVAFLLVHYVGITSTLVADGVISLLGAFVALKLSEAPRSNGGQEALKKSAWRAMHQLSSNAQARWLVVLGASLGTATYIGAWLSAPYLNSVGIAAGLFGTVLAARSLIKAVISHRVQQQPRYFRRNSYGFAVLALMTSLAMASGQLWLIWMLMGHDIVQALQQKPIEAQLNDKMDHDYRATLNSLTNVFQRLSYAVIGPLVGWLVDAGSLSVGIIVCGVTLSCIAVIATIRLKQLDSS